ncbi:MAG: hydantoinase B/oxoprolinase family protein, partial [Nitrospinaceae bacterium]
MNLRYQGTDTSVMIPQPPDGDYAGEFRERYRREMGFDLAGRDIQVDDLRVRAVAKGPGLKMTRLPQTTKEAEPVSTTRCYFESGWLDTPVFLMDHLRPGHHLSGPAIFISDTSTLLLEPDCAARITDFGDVEIDVPTAAKKIIETHADPIQLSIFSHLFMSIAEQMGWALQRMAVSTNIKERLDFSCALFDSEGNLVANAPHQPVHLGSMGEAVRRQIEIYKDDLHKEDVWVTNHPIASGSHLPDITVITPVLNDGMPIFFVASRGHHPDIGGISPGSMPPFSKTLDEEGVCIKSFKLVDRGVFQEQGIKYLLGNAGEMTGKHGEKKTQGARA